MKKGIKNNSKNKPNSQNENLRQKTENPKPSSFEMNQPKPRNDTLESPLRSISFHDSPSTPSPTQSTPETKMHIIKLIDFDFSPKHIKITCKSAVRWIVCDNIRKDDSIYSGEARKFVISIDEIDIESEVLVKGQHFDHVFEYRGIYSIKGNYPRMTCTIEVYDDEEDLRSSLQMNYHERFKNDFMKKQAEKVVVHKEQNPQKEFKLNRKDLEMDECKQLLKNLSYEKITRSNKSRSFCEGSDDENDKPDPLERQGNTSVVSYDEFADFLIQEYDESNTSVRFEKNLTGEKECDAFLDRLTGQLDNEKHKEPEFIQHIISEVEEESPISEKISYENNFIDTLQPANEIFEHPILLEKIEEAANEHSTEVNKENELDDFTKFLKNGISTKFNEIFTSIELTEEKKLDIMRKSNSDNCTLNSRLLAMKRFLDNSNHLLNELIR